MKPAARIHLENAHDSLRRAEACLGVLSVEPLVAAGIARDAYYAAFHAAKALLYERSGASSKKHGSIHRAFENTTIGDLSIDTSLRKFLAESYELKLIGDYGVDPTKRVTPDNARTALAEAKRFVAAVAALLP